MREYVGRIDRAIKDFGCCGGFGIQIPLYPRSCAGEVSSPQPLLPKLSLAQPVKQKFLTPTLLITNMKIYII